MINFVRKKLHGRTILKAHLWQSLANYFQQGFGIVFGVILARILNPQDFGEYAFALSTVVLAFQPANWSLNAELLADGGRTPGLRERIVSFGWSIAGVKFLILLALCGWLFYSGDFQRGILCAVIGLIEAPREMNNIQRAWLESLGQFKPNFLSVVTNTLCCILFVIPAAFLGLGPYALVLPGIFLVIGDYFIYGRAANRTIWLSPGLRVIRHLFRKGVWMWLANLTDIGLIRMDKWFVGHAAGTEALGYYNRAFGYAPLSHMALNSLAANPTVVALSRAELASKRRRLFFKTSLLLFGGGLINWGLLHFFSRQIVLFVFGPKWVDSIPMFQAFAPLSIAFACTYLPLAALYAQRRYADIAVVRVIATALCAATLFALGKGATGEKVAWVLQWTLAAQGVVLFWRSRRFFWG